MNNEKENMFQKNESDKKIKPIYIPGISESGSEKYLGEKIKPIYIPGVSDQESDMVSRENNQTNPIIIEKPENSKASVVSGDKKGNCNLNPNEFLWKADLTSNGSRIGGDNLMESTTNNMEFKPQLNTNIGFPSPAWNTYAYGMNGLVNSNMNRKEIPCESAKRVPGKQPYQRAELQYVNGYYQVVVFYQSGANRMATMRNIYGRCQVCRVEYETEAIKERKFQIRFENGVMVLGKQKGLTEDKLYTYFTGAGIDLKRELPEIPEKAIKEAFFSFFKGWIENTPDKVTIDGRAGWVLGKWLCAEYNPYTEREAVPNLPIMSKNFGMNQFGEDDSKWLKVFPLYREIEDETYRILFLETLVEGILASMFNEKKANIKYFLNLVLTESMQIEPFCKFFQIFNRGQMQYYELSGKEKAEEYLKKIKDEVMILHTANGISKYKQNQEKERLNRIVDEVCYGAGHGSIVVINSEETDLPEGINIFLNTSFITERMSQLLQQDVVGAFLQKLVSWIEKEPSRLSAILSGVSSESILLNEVQTVLETFCRCEGVDMYKELGVTKETIKEINSKFEDMEDELDVSKIVEMIRANMRKFYVADIQKKKYTENTCYFDSETMWIPKEILDKMLLWGGIENKIRALNKLKEERILLGKRKLTSKISVEGHKIECYKIEKAVLNTQGKVDIESIGKETK